MNVHILSAVILTVFRAIKNITWHVVRLLVGQLLQNGYQGRVHLTLVGVDLGRKDSGEKLKKS